MKADVYGRPNFTIYLDPEDANAMIDVLMELSIHHYDGTCREASQYGGFIYGWSNVVPWSVVHDPEAITVSATFHELDITLKLCEMTHAYFSDEPDKRDLAHKWSKAVRTLLTKANEIVPQWKLEIAL